MAEPRDAATVLILRDRAAGGVEVFMVKRHGASGFMAGAHVFPGGKLDAADSHAEVLAMVRGRSAAEARTALGEPALSPEVALGLFVAGARETFEEAGILLAELAETGPLAQARSRLNQKAPFAEVLRALGAPLSLDRLVPLSRWITPEVEPRRFDTRFFLARAPLGQEASHDAHETTEHAWFTPGEALDGLKAGRVLLPPPTLRSLEWLAESATVDAALARAASAPPPRVQPVITEVDGKLAICLPGDALHPEPGPVIEGPTRMVLENGRFWSR